MSTATKGRPKAAAANGPGADGDGAVRLVPVDAIGPSGLNPRKTFDEAELAKLAASIRAQGVLQPILVRPTPPGAGGPRYQLAVGERRLRAARLAGLRVIPAAVRALSDRDLLEIAVVENDQRADVSPIEKADGYARLVEGHGVSVEDLAARVGRSPSTVRAVLALRRLPPPAREAVADGRLPASTAQLVARIPDAKLRALAAREVLQAGWAQAMSFRQAKEHVERHYTVELKQAPFPTDDAGLVPAAGACGPCPKRAGNLRAADPEAWPGVRADVCTDPACYRAKEAAWQDRAEAEARAAGAKVLPAAEAARLFACGPVRPSSGWCDLADTCWEVKPARGDGRHRTYEQLLAGHLAPADVVLCRHPHNGRLHRLVPKELATKLLKEHHGLGKERRGCLSETAGELRAEQRAEARLRGATDRALLAAAYDTARALALARGPEEVARGWEVLRAAARLVAGGLWGDVGALVCRRRGLAVKHKADQDAALAKLIAEARGADLCGLLAELAAGQFLLSGWRSQQGPAEALAAALAIDRKQIETETRRRLAAEAAAKKNGKAGKAGEAAR